MESSRHLPSISLHPIVPEDLEFLYRVYASTRMEEMALTGWAESEIEAFLRQQFNLQHIQYQQNYPEASFDIILCDEKPAGRLYVDRGKKDIRIMDIALLPEFRGQGIGSRIMKELISEAERKELILSLHVEQNNPALNWYQQLGFERKTLIGVYVFMERRPGGETGLSNH